MSPTPSGDPAPSSSGLLAIQALRGFAVMGVVLMHVPLYLANKLQCRTCCRSS
jgi:peptidoglycan/LPS O-acetylase OafA/YrhL